MKGFLDSREGGRKKKNNSNDSPINIVMESTDRDELNKVLGTSSDTSAPKVVNEGGMNEVGTQPATPTPNLGQLGSYADVTGKPSRTKVKFRTLFIPKGNGIDVVIPEESIRAISACFVNTAYGFFLGKRVAYPVVANYVRNTWGKYGLVRSMFSMPTGLFSFQFRSRDGLDTMLKNGPWSIYNNLLILKKWHPNVNLLKEDVGIIPVWFKLYGVFVTAFSEDGLSAVTTKLGTPLMLYSYTSDMCLQSWGRSSYARAVIELRADMELKDNIMVAMPRITGKECPRNLGVGETKNLKKPSQMPKGFLVGQKMGFKPTKQQVCQPVSKNPTANNSGNKKKGVEPTNEDEVASVYNEMASFLAKKDGYGTQSLLEQWKDFHEHDDYKYDPYRDDIYEGHEIPEMLQAFYDNLYIKVRGRKKK
uniref:DUF4283 domain-containing protein n=1 Tax=Tanacetum cinerariifolium TaxID=118510 RepID=A0A6L2L0M9_TANCI|nr:hypothetical protein [Tanacetum cinerariifolium]